MANPNDNSELFEIFQNQMDLEEEQEKGKKEREKSKKEEEEKEKKEQEEKEEKTEEAQEDTPEAPASQPEKSAEPSSTGSEPGRSQRVKHADSSASAQPGTRGKKTAPNRPSEPESKPAPEQPETPSSTVGHDQSGDPGTETGMYIKELEEEKELEGKIILSRGSSVFLLVLAFVAVVGSYFIGRQAGTDPGAMTQGPANTVNETQDLEGTLNNGNDSSVPTSSNNTSNQSSGGSSAGSAIQSGKAYYTFAIIGFSSEGNELRKNLEILREQTRIKQNQLGYLYNPVGKRQYRIVIGVLDSRKKAEDLKGAIRAELDKTKNAREYRTDIIEITAEEAKRIMQ